MSPVLLCCGIRPLVLASNPRKCTLLSVPSLLNVTRGRARPSSAQEAAGGRRRPHTFPSRFFFLSRLAWDFDIALSCSSSSVTVGCACAVALDGAESVNVVCPTAWDRGAVVCLHAQSDVITCLHLCMQDAGWQHSPALTTLVSGIEHAGIIPCASHVQHAPGRCQGIGD